MPAPIGEFLSREVYGGKLQSHHRIKSTDCIRLVDCERGEEANRNFSWVVGSSPVDCSQLPSQFWLCRQNNEEINVVVQCCRQLQGHNYCVVTAYDAQRNEVGPNSCSLACSTHLP